MCDAQRAQSVATPTPNSTMVAVPGAPANFAKECRNSRAVRHSFAIEVGRSAHTVAVHVQRIVDRVGVAIIAGGTHLTGNGRATVVRVAHAIAVRVLEGTGTVAVGIQHIIDRAGVAVITARPDLARYRGTVVIHVAHTIAVRVLEGSHALAAGVQHIIDRAGVAIVAA